MATSALVPGRLRATGPVGHALNLAVFAALYATPWYAPLAFTSDAVLIFYGGSMLLAAIRSYAGCEVLTVSNLAAPPRRPGRLPSLLSPRPPRTKPCRP